MSAALPGAMRPRYATVILDVDSTVAGIEGIDWLAARRGADVARRVAELTDRAMAGEIPLESVYGERLRLVSPTVADVAALGAAYVAAVAPGCREALARLRACGAAVLLMSGGLRQAIAPLAAHLGVDTGALHAVDVWFGADGGYAGFDGTSPLATAQGKRVLVERLGLARPVLAVGDGATDLAMRGAADAFAAFTGFVHRAPVVAAADVALRDFAELATLVLT